MNILQGYRLGMPRKMVVIIVAMVSIAIILNIIWWFDKGLIFHDEAWQLLNFRPGINTVDYSNWHHVGAFLFSENLFLTRLLTFGLLFSSAFLFGGMVKRFIDVRIPWWVLALLFAISQFILNAPVLMLPSYVNLNVAAVNLSMAAFLLYLSSNRSNVQIAALAASGFFIGTLPLIQITNSLFLPVLLSLVLVIGHPGSGRRDITVLILGMLTYPLLYFTLIQSPAEFILKFREAINYLNIDDDYGWFGIFRWHARTSGCLHSPITCAHPSCPPHSTQLASGKQLGLIMWSRFCV